MRKSIIAIALLTTAFLFIGLTACTMQKSALEDTVKSDMTSIETSGEFYENEAVGIGLVFPPEYIGKYTIFQSDVSAYSVFHNATHALFKDKDPCSERGALFTIEKWPISSQADIDYMNEVATPLFQTTEFAYYLRGSMDCYTSDMENPATKEYLTLYSYDLISKIAASAYPLDDNGGGPKTIPAKVEAVVSADFATDKVLNNYSSFDEFIEFKEDGCQRIIFTSNTSIRDFNYIEVGNKDSGSNIIYFENSVLYTLDELTPEKPFIVTWMEQGLIPHRGITFKDENNTKRYFYISMSGADGSLLLTEFENNED